MAKTFRLTRAADKAVATLVADRVEHDGAGHRFFNAENQMVAQFAYGVLTEAVPADVAFVVPS